MSINKFYVAGNICRDPELRSTASGTPVLSFAVANNEFLKDGTQYANYFDMDMFGSRAEKLANILKKGMKVVVTGRVHQERWEDKKTGGSRSRHVIYVDDVELMQRTSRADESAVQESEYSDIPF